MKTISSRLPLSRFLADFEYGIHYCFKGFKLCVLMISLFSQICGLKEIPILDETSLTILLSSANLQILMQFCLESDFTSWVTWSRRGLVYSVWRKSLGSYPRSVIKTEIWKIYLVHQDITSHQLIHLFLLRPFIESVLQSLIGLCINKSHKYFNFSLAGLWLWHEILRINQIQFKGSYEALIVTNYHFSAFSGLIFCPSRYNQSPVN